MNLLFIYYFFIFIAGTFIGSFLNLVSDRVINGEPILWGRSHCDNCQTPLKPTNLIPVLSFLIQKGKCAYCGVKLSWFYPAAEVMTGAMLVLAAYLTQVLTNMQNYSLIGFIYLSIVFSFMVILFLTDAKYRLIPDVVVWPGIIFIFLFHVFFTGYQLFDLYTQLNADEFGKYLLQAGYFTDQLLSSLINFGIVVASALIIALFFWVLIKITKGRGMGGGDIRLGLFIGLFNGFPTNILAIFLGFVLGALYSLVLMVLRKKTLKDSIAFGPFLLIGSLISLLWGVQLINWYFNLI